jgi:uncharacterized protein YdiU (UPF0061 family)
MNVGFIHGVMNTDNMTISGETIDYGPCAFIEAYDPAAVFSSIDHGGRYAFANQPPIARWNLARLAETLLPLMALADDAAAMQQAVAEVTRVIDAFPGWHAAALLSGQRAKLGLQRALDDAADAALAESWLKLLQSQAVDHTLAWRRLGHAAGGEDLPLRALFDDPGALDPWLAQWHQRCALEDGSGEGAGAERVLRMQGINPWLIPRNHRVEEALAAASEDGDLQPFRQLLAALRRPFDEDTGLAHYAEPAPAELTASYQTFCGT